MADPQKRETTGSGERNSTTVTTTTTAPATYGSGMFGNQDLVSALIDTYQGTSAQVANLSEILGQQQEEVRVSGKAAETALSSASGMKTTIDKSKAELGFRATKMVEDTQRQMGLDPSQQGNLISQVLAKNSALSSQYDAARAEYDAAANTGLMDNPMGYIMAQLKLPALAARVNNLDSAINRNNEELATRQQQFATVKTNQVINQADELRANAYAQAEAEALARNAELAQLHQKNSSYLAQATMQQIDVVMKTGGMTMQGITSIRHFKDMDEQKQLREQQMRLANIQIQDALNKKKEDKEAEDYWNARLKIVSDAMGWPTPMKMSLLKTLPPEERQQWMERAGQGGLGASLSDALPFIDNKLDKNNLAATGGIGLAFATKRIVDSAVSEYYMGQAELEWKKTSGGVGKPLSGKELRAAALKLYQADIERSSVGKGIGNKDLSSDVWGSGPKDIYNPIIPEWGAYLQSGRAGAKTETGRALAALGATKRDEAIKQSDVNTAITSLVPRLAKGEITPEQAAQDVAGFINDSALWQQETSRYGMMGIGTPNTYKFTLKYNGDTVSVNLADPVAVRAALGMLARRSTDFLKSLLIQPYGFDPASGEFGPK